MLRLTLALLVVQWTPSTAHVSLTFPEARFPPLDFLDASRTAGPCGVPRPQRPHFTTLMVGSVYNVSWTAAYPPLSGHKLRVIDADGLTIEQVSPLNGLEFTQPDKSSWDTIKFTTRCEQCTLILEQERNGVLFRSCADVNIVGSLNDEEKCSSRGSMVNGNCQCETGFTGNICQYLASCERDDDCMNGGKCIDTDALVQRVCVCAYSYFGPKCDQRFNEGNTDCFAYFARDEQMFDQYGLFNSGCYNRHDLTADDVVYSRIVDEEDVEIVVDFATTSWTSLGWRPAKLHNSCRLFPHLEDTRPANTEVDEETRLHQVPKQAMPKNNGFLESALNAELHTMDCMDMVVASMVDGRLFVGDYYSRDRSTPLQDYWYDGELSLVAAYGVEVDGRTVIMFRRQIREIEPTDHPLGPNTLLVAWAKGTGSDKFKYHGPQRGSTQLNFCRPVKPAKNAKSNTTSNEVAFGVKNVAHERIDGLEKMKTTKAAPTTTEEASSTSLTSTKSVTSTKTATSSSPFPRTPPPSPTTTTQKPSSATLLSPFYSFALLYFFLSRNF